MRVKFFSTSRSLVHVR